MYSRAPRITDPSARSSATTRTGPGAYEIRTHTQTNGYAPFLCLSSRQSVFDRSVGELCSPGPAHYDGNSVVGGHSLQNRSRRFEEYLSDGPGPGAYDIFQPFGKKSDFRSCEMGVPSIPSPGQAYGYEENEHRVLCRHKPPSADQSLGPAFYSPAQVESRYKGVHFGQMTGKRAEVKVCEGPGPGEYHPEGDHSVCYVNVNLRRELKIRNELQINRYHELLPLLEEKKGVPGPGQYLVKSQFDKPTSMYGAADNRPPFMSQTPRFRSGKEVAPPVGTYNDPRCALDSLKKATGLNRKPFSLTAARFLPENRKHTTPGPGAYNVFDYGIARDSVKKAHLESVRKGGFGATAQRTLIFLSKDEAHSPGPTHYKVDKAPMESYKQQPTAVFRSATKRLTTSLHTKDTPSPTLYQVREAFEKTYGRPHARPRTDAAQKRQSCFLSSAPRNTSFLLSDPQIPGPGHYSPEMKTRPKLALIGSHEDRFKQSKDTTPGPGAYVLSPVHLDTVLKGTFNVTLRNPLVPHDQTVHLRDITPELFVGSCA
uniref:Sperm-tail PG-rich repeat-containing protein 2 n=1 Tax=Electrophorus electricus TaxID=8005 RepID=A0A4W4EX60_ELEEL